MIKLIVAIVIVIFVVYMVNRWLDWSKKRLEEMSSRGSGGNSIESQKTSAELSVVQKRYLSWNSSYNCEVVGESHYQRSLLTIAGAKEEESKSLEVIAELQHVPANRYDPNAQAVYIEGKQVGHLSQRDAHALIREKGKLHLNSHVVILVKAKIIGGWKNSRNEGSFGVVLDMPPMKDIAKVISSVSFEDSDQKRAKSIPLNRDQKRFFDYMGIKRDESINSLNVDQYIADKKIEIRSSEDRDLKEKLMTYQKRERVILDLLEDWRDRDNGVIFLYDEIKMPSELQVLKTLEELESEAISWDEIKSNNEMFYNKLLEKYPKLKK
ncbi:hypothetical protein GCM10007161_13460 [Ignatzschineria indica]|uniref:HIRAN domain-containing protein n=1 Tax=Ignatzschineria indica TaxID=472583 RepID=A0A2U2AJP6_9GAMM|nr:hypothetical protein [Ignatzschineria indica]PWD83058.1 hypothetical protein DC082_06430 [Ignatzschineria indica]GGZ83280.1 hypothetical protein GCM10007161_13460 [Ignatzschineria indica]